MDGRGNATHSRRVQRGVTVPSPANAELRGPHGAGTMVVPREGPEGRKVEVCRCLLRLSSGTFETKKDRSSREAAVI